MELTQFRIPQALIDGSYGAELEFPCPLLGPVFEPAQYPTMYELSLVPNAKFDVNIIPGIDKMRITNFSLIIIIFQSPNLHPYDQSNHSYCILPTSCVTSIINLTKMKDNESRKTQSVQLVLERNNSTIFW